MGSVVLASAMDEPSDDTRFVELETLEAIYPEISYPHGGKAKDPFTFEIEVPVQPVAPVTVTFPAAAGSVVDLNHDPQHQQQHQQQHRQPEVDSLQISHLPALRLRISLPDGYPESEPPKVSISTTPEWLRRETLGKLEADSARLWEEAGRDMVAFTYIDHIQRSADDIFGSINSAGSLEVDPEHKLAVLDYDINAKRTAFERETFDCGVCLDPKKGSKCHKMLECGHIFCLQCLQDFYNDAIEQGYLSTVRCLAPNCAKDRSKAQSQSTTGKRLKKDAATINPSELLQIGLDEEQVKRYVTLKYKTELESDKNTIYCPRQWCNGAARSKKHRKPSGLMIHEASDDGEESEDEKDEGRDADTTNDAEGRAVGDGSKTRQKVIDKFNPADLLAVCEDCGFAFCSRCSQSWHGEFYRCSAKRDKEELTAEEAASLEYLRLHTSPCPTCNAPAQKTHGCNHMICGRCDTHFCYLCSAWLEPANPYKHYNQPPVGMYASSSCYMRLWELQDGDGNDVGIGFDGGPVRHLPPAAAAAPAPAPEEPLPDVEDELAAEAAFFALRDRDNQRRERENQRLERQGRQLAVAREAPLVLRLMDDPAINRPTQPVAAPQAAGQARPPVRGALAAPAPPAPPAPPAAAGADPGAQLAPNALVGRGGQNAARRGGIAAPRGVIGRGRGGGAVAARGGGGGVGVARQVVMEQRAPLPMQGRRRQNQQAAAGALRNAQAGGVGAAPQRQHQVAGHNNDAAGPDPAQEAWVRQFVQMALIDAEDEIGGDSDSDDDEYWMIR